MRALKQNLGLILIFGAIGAYVVFAGKSGICPLCTAVTDLVGLSSSTINPVPEKTVPEEDWTVLDLEGKAIHGSDLTGKVVILDFWATWCPPCRMEIPELIELQDQYAEKGVVILGISVDQAGVETIQEFINKSGINYRVAMANPEMIRQFGGIKSIPTTLILDRHGNIVRRHVGYATMEAFEEDIRDLL